MTEEVLRLLISELRTIRIPHADGSIKECPISMLASGGEAVLDEGDAIRYLAKAVEYLTAAKSKAEFSIIVRPKPG